MPAGNPERLAVVGAGYVGLATAVCLAHLGHHVVCAERDPAKLARLSSGEPTIVEDGLPELLRDGLASGRLRFVPEAVQAVPGAGYVFLCVPTPARSDGSADVTILQQVAAEIGPHLDRDAVVVNKSTVPVGSTQVVEQLLGRADVAVVSNPEFLREGRSVHDCLHPDRVVVGAQDQAAAARVGALFARTGAPLIVTDAATAEMIKYASNAFLATRLSFVNAVATLAERLGADVRDVLLGLGYDHRIGFEFLRPGPGWGGSCFPKDTSALLYMAEQAGYDFPLLRAVIDTNEAQLASVVDKVRAAAGGDLAGRRVAAWGLAFKAGTDDRRDSPAVWVVRRLADEGALVRAYDPTTVPAGPGAGVAGSAGVPGGDDGGGAGGSGSAVPELEGRAEIVADPYAACEDAAALVILTEWDELRWLDFTKVRDAMAAPAVVDGRNLLDPAQLRRLGFTYIGIGRP
ncbi:MAG: UDP-glucose/GDP-mannose dehydrogenase family protein [Actinomycetota bacterium]|nr:UDP-glucose/GDP-mannose dehydrogenase family protein [Actinomycetota bacterium]